MDRRAIYYSGIHADTGEYLSPPRTLEQIAELAGKEHLDFRAIEDYRIWLDEALRGRRLREGDSSSLGEAGWGVVFAATESDEKVDAVLTALGELIEHRKQQATGKDERYFRIYRGEAGYHPREDRHDFLKRNQAPFCGPADPEKMPYYLLIVGDPEAIPYEFQYQLDVQYAVGRIWFEGLEQYERYAKSVVAAETTPVPRARTAAFFGPRHANDLVTELSADELTIPLANWVRRRCPGWTVKSIVGPDATRERLGRLLGGCETPAFLFTAGHGTGYDAGDARQAELQGALVCQEWPGPGHFVEEPHFFAARDVGEQARVGGMITFHFACNSAGTSHLNDLDPDRGKVTAHRAFIASLPRRLLTHENGGALAVIGHVGGACRTSFTWPGAGAQTAAFEDTVKRLLDGAPVGYAMEAFNERHADLSVSLSDLQQDREWGLEPDSSRVAGMWSARNDARDYVVLGDPAVRLTPAPSQR